MANKSLAQLATESGVCVSPLFDGSAFCVIHLEGLFYTEQTAEALKRLVEFLREHGKLGEMLSFVAGTRELAELGRVNRVKLKSARFMPAWKLQHIGHVTMEQWLSMQDLG